MPLLKHAKKKLKQDKKRTARNKRVKEIFKKLVKAAKVERTAESLSKAFSAVDKAAKKNIIPKNRAARIKSSLSKEMTAPAKAVVSVAKSTQKKKVVTKKKTATSQKKKKLGYKSKK